MSQGICIIDYGMGNLRSVYNKVKVLCDQVSLTADKEEILAADKLIMPGVGHFGQGMENLRRLGLIEVLNEKVVERGTPVLGICLGMQLMMSTSEEGNCAGLNWIEGRVVKFDSSQVDSPHFKTPHMGWNTLVSTNHHMLEGTSNEHVEYYFCHSFHAAEIALENITSTCRYGYEFTSSIGKGNIQGVQFHPEKSHDLGSALIEKFLKMKSEVLV